MEERVHASLSAWQREKQRGEREREKVAHLPSTATFFSLSLSLFIYPRQLPPFTSAEKLELPAKDRSEHTHPPIHPFPPMPRINSLEIVTLNAESWVRGRRGNGRKGTFFF